MKKFLIIGNGNAVSYKDVFPLIKDNKIWLGVTHGTMRFNVPEEYPLYGTSCGVDEKGQLFIDVMMCTWFTNMEHEKRNKPLDLYKKYNADEYPKYENYDAIEVKKVTNIPVDYDDIMGVPITFLYKYCPEQFEIIGSPEANVVPLGWKKMSQKFLDLYYSQGGTGQYTVGNRLEHYITSDGKAVMPYKRILIRRCH